MIRVNNNGDPILPDVIKEHIHKQIEQYKAENPHNWY